MTTSDPMTAEKCEPPPELRGVDGWHWVQWPSGREVPQFWGGSDDEGCQWHAGTPTLSMRYLSPVLTPAEVAALRAERDAAVAENARLREALEKIAARDFNCAPHQHGMAAQEYARAALEPAP